MVVSCFKFLPVHGRKEKGVLGGHLDVRCWEALSRFVVEESYNEITSAIFFCKNTLSVIDILSAWIGYRPVDGKPSGKCSGCQECG